MKKIIISAALAAALFTGCGGVDKERLAQLTGDKSFEQVKEAYKSAVLREMPEDAEVYAYYLSKNEEKIVGFDFENFSLKVESDHKELVTKLETTFKKFEDNLNKVSYSTLQNELRMGGFMMGQAKVIDDYLKKIKELIDKKRENDVGAKKAKEAAWQKEREEARARGEVGTTERSKINIPQRTPEEWERLKREHAAHKEVLLKKMYEGKEVKK